MIAEIRTYTIKPGSFDAFLDVFNKQSVPNQRRFGVNVVGAWADRALDRVVWIRQFDSLDDQESKLAAYAESPERLAVLPIMERLVAKAEVQIVEDVFHPSAVADPSVLR
jgi:hypothetical protein